MPDAVMRHALLFALLRMLLLFGAGVARPASALRRFDLLNPPWVDAALLPTEGSLALGQRLRERNLRPIAGLKSFRGMVLRLGLVADKFIAIEDTRVMFDLASAPNNLWGVEGAGHVDLSQMSGVAARGQQGLGLFEFRLKRARPCV